MIRKATERENVHWLGNASRAGKVLRIFDLMEQLDLQAGSKNRRCGSESHRAVGRDLWELLDSEEHQEQCRQMIAGKLNPGEFTRTRQESSGLHTVVELLVSDDGKTIDFRLKQVRCPFSYETARVIQKLMLSGSEDAWESQSPVSTSQHIKNVARQLGVAPTTVRRHLQIAKKQAGCSNMSNFQFGAYCVLNGLCEDWGDLHDLAGSHPGSMNTSTNH